MSSYQPPPPDWLQNLVGMRLVDVFFGAAGGIVRGLVVRNLSWSQRVASMVVGALTAGSLGPPAGAVANAIAMRWFDWFGLSVASFDVGGSAVFLTGVCGMTICDAIVRWARRWRDGPPPLLPPPKPGG